MGKPGSEQRFSGGSRGGVVTVFVSFFSLMWDWIYPLVRHVGRRPPGEGGEEGGGGGFARCATHTHVA